jgi:hypothetical protein
VGGWPFHPIRADVRDMSHHPIWHGGAVSAPLPMLSQPLLAQGPVVPRREDFPQRPSRATVGRHAVCRLVLNLLSQVRF